ncbi:mechanosensitive ion channel family protein [Rubrivirga litoralis]|uniref:Mechanosensitive ion channel family protein n=1 Tax=Rubrivirga litoralis TaxID=3075598 RepID=A0ABU3BTK9_9BACT|nr:mechanosensitive ion channel family protein [Rubrivirga sp. F394]MDT0632570.1 mechanosensitive ion channel family protein [Rubrivirga sp. F394]
MLRSVLRQLLDAEHLDRMVLGVPVEDWLLLAAALLATGLLLAVTRAAIRWQLRRDTRSRTNAWFAQAVDNVLERTRGYFLFALTLYLASRLVGWNEQGLTWTATLLTLASLLQAGRWITGLIEIWLDRYRAQKLDADASAVTSMQAIGILAQIAVWSVIALMFLANIGINVTALVAGLGIGGVAIGLAVQNILGDLFASLSIVLDKPFVIGDTLAVGSEMGTVQHIGLKSTRIQSLSGEQIVFSNGDLLASRIRNYQRMTERRVVLTFGVTYDTPPDEIAAVPGRVREVIEGLRSDDDTQGAAPLGGDPPKADAPVPPPVRFDRAHFRGFGASSLDFEVVYYVLVPDYARYMDAQQAINLGLLRAFGAHGVEFAFPTRTLHVASDARPARDGSARDNSARNGSDAETPDRHDARPADGDEAPAPPDPA